MQWRIDKIYFKEFEKRKGKPKNVILRASKVKREIYPENYYFSGGLFAVYHAFNADYITRLHTITQIFLYVLV